MEADRFCSYYQEVSGLRLAITQAIIHNHRGTVSVTSQADICSQFVVCLPASAIAK